jgi:hypothetical protein
MKTSFNQTSFDENVIGPNVIIEILTKRFGKTSFRPKGIQPIAVVALGRSFHGSILEPILRSRVTTPAL